MIRLATTLLAVFAGAGIAAGAPSASGGQPRVAVVLSAPALQDAVPSDVALRVPRTAAEQLGATHVLAAGHYDTVITVGVDQRVAVAPVAARYPGTTFVNVPAERSALARALADAR